MKELAKDREYLVATCRCRSLLASMVWSLLFILVNCTASGHDYSSPNVYQSSCRGQDAILGEQALQAGVIRR